MQAQQYVEAAARLSNPAPACVRRAAPARRTSGGGWTTATEQAPEPRSPIAASEYKFPAPVSLPRSTILSLQAGQTLSHYRIVSKLGAGGMGEVYLAEDLTLDRRVALKVLSPALAQDPARLERFQREAKAVAALNHPHIVTIYSVQEADGIRFIAMELVEGDSLSLWVRPGGLPVAKVCEIGIALADALAAAHEKGIVHRDLKPANVMITPEGRVKVLDFGLAKLATGGLFGTDSETNVGTRAFTLTTEGAVVGTVPYMSPEQLQGAPVDHRTDLFSLGVLLYELATGERPFIGGNAAALTSSILRDTPPPLVEVREDVPGGTGAHRGALPSQGRSRSIPDRARRLQQPPGALSGAGGRPERTARVLELAGTAATRRLGHQLRSAAARRLRVVFRGARSRCRLRDSVCRLSALARFAGCAVAVGRAARCRRWTSIVAPCFGGRRWSSSRSSPRSGWAGRRAPPASRRRCLRAHRPLPSCRLST